MLESIITLNHFSSFCLGLVPTVFLFLWTLISIDFKNFMGSRKAYTEYTAKDPVNCYQNFEKKSH